MTRTSTKVQFGLFALELKQDSTPATSTDLQPFSKIADLKTDQATGRPYASYEPDFWLLDGEYKFLPANTSGVHVGLMSLEMSGSDGSFAASPELTITFGQAHDIESLTLHFAASSGDFASHITVAYYDAADALIRTDDYFPSDTEFSTGQPVSDFKKIVIAFHSTNRPWRYLRLTGIDYGELFTFSGADIKAASVVEESDPLSAELRVNTFEMRLHSSDAAFSIINPEGRYAELTERLPLAVYEIVDSQAVFIGRYYLDEWENLSETEIEFRCIDRLGVLDTLTYRGGIWTGAGIALEDLLEALLGGIGVPYELDPQLTGTVMRGWLPIGSYRDALQQIAFAAGASVSCARSGAIQIVKTKIAAVESAVVTIARSEQGMGGALGLRPLVTGVEVVSHNYVAGTASRDLYDDMLEPGSYEIAFTRPMHTLSATGATITESGVNYAVLSVAVAGAVTLSGKEYIDTTRVHGVYATPGESLVQNILRVEGATLVGPANVAAVAQRVYDYHQQRYRQRLKLFAPSVEVGQVALVDTLYGKQIRGVIEKMDTDLSGGMVSRVELVGVEHV